MQGKLTRLYLIDKNWHDKDAHNSSETSIEWNVNIGKGQFLAT